MKRIRAVIFDFDGTVADTLPMCLEGMRRAAHSVTGRTFTDAEIAATFGPSEEGSAAILAPNDASRCLELYLHHYECLHGDALLPFEGIDELLTSLRDQGVRVGLVTGKGPHSCKISLQKLRLQAEFEMVETGCPQGPCKPEGILKMLRAWEIAPNEGAYIGDSPSDVRSARAAGVAALGAAWAPTANAEAICSRGPDAVFLSVTELAEWIAERV